MIIVQLKGGLGNQLFQYAAGLSLAKHHNAPVKVDITNLLAPDEQIGTTRNYELQHILQPPAIATGEEVKHMLSESPLLRYYRKTLPPYKRKIYKEESFRFDPHFFQSKNHLYLKGYRQSELYFQHIQDDVRTNLFLQSSLYNDVHEFGKQLKNEQSISIHIRRGDYTNQLVQDYHGVLDQQYYQHAINLIEAKVKQANLYVFSDNPSWVKEHLQFQQPVQFVSGAISKNHYEDFYLMSCCRHNIIANSSFSWWAAWFNSNPNKNVLAPMKWFNAAHLDTTDLIPPGWMRI